MGLGFNDANLQFFSGAFSGTPDESILRSGLANSRGAGSTYQRFGVFWMDVTQGSVAPPLGAAADPGWSGYRWESTDRMVRAIVAAGLTPIPVVTKAPPWAEGPNRPPVSADVPRGTWRPSPPALGEFATALARRYSGAYPDPQDPGRAFPAIKTFQAWNEPNLYAELNPQWERTSSGYLGASAPQYRALVNAFSAGVKRTQPSAHVVGAATAPFGDLSPGGARIPPALFYRQLLCATKRRGHVTVRRNCPTLTFDGWAHNAYPVGPPQARSSNADDVSVADLPKLTSIVAAAAKTGLIGRAAAKDLWITEISWESKPDPEGLSLETHAQYMQGAFFELWKAGARNVLWWNSRDDREGAGWASTLQSGIFARGSDPLDPATDVRKPAWTAFHFPFTAYRSKGIATLWARGPGRGPVIVQARGASGWRRVATLHPRSGNVFTGRLRIGNGVPLRAQQQKETSLTWQTD